MYQSTHTGAQIDEAVDKALNYGLGGNGKYLSSSVNINDIVESGFYYWGNAPTNAPFAYGNMTVSASPARVVQTIVSTQNGGVVIRTLYNGVWSNNVIGSNRNLLDNPWFTVNQRGQSSYTGGVYTFDRWKILATGYSVAYNADGSICITKTSGTTGQFAQFFEWDDKTTTFTFSVMSPDGTTYTRTGDYTNTGYTAYTSPDGLVFRLYMDINNGVLRVNIYSAATQTGTLNIKAVKLEKGSVSTIANDVAPDYGTELAKCQRYFHRIAASPNGTNVGVAVSTTSANYVSMAIPITPCMRYVASPTVTIYGDFVAADGSGVGTAQNATYSSKINLSGDILTLGITASRFATKGAFIVWHNANSYIDISCDL